MVRRILITTFSLFLSIAFYGQNSAQSKGKVLAINHISNNSSTKGDSLSIKVKNLTPDDRSFTLEVLELSDEPYYFNAVYSAYINYDTSFFEKLRAAKQSSKRNNIQYTLPNYMTYPYDIKGSSDTTLSIIIKGNSIKKGNLIKLRLTSDIVNDEFETLYSDPIKVFILPE